MGDLNHSSAEPCSLLLRDRAFLYCIGAAASNLVVLPPGAVSERLGRVEGWSERKVLYCML